MKVYKFKTSINCGGCVRGVTPFMDKLKNIKWSVDTDSPDNILTVETDDVSEEEIEKMVTKAGFKIERI